MLVILIRQSNKFSEVENACCRLSSFVWVALGVEVENASSISSTQNWRKKWWFIRKKKKISFKKLFLIQCFEAARTIVQIKTVGDAKSQIKIFFAKLLSPMNWNENNLPINCFSLSLSHSFFWFQSSWIILSDVKCINGIGKRSLDRISVDRNCVLSLDRNYVNHLIEFHLIESVDRKFK